MTLGFQKFLSEVFVNGKFLKILPSKNFLLCGIAINWLPNNDNVTQYEQGLLIEMYETVTNS